MLPETVATVALHLVRREMRRYGILYGHGLSGLDVLPVENYNSDLLNYMYTGNRI